MHDSPQNPYDSYLVEASAGSGKTYQLSRRFLFLVGSGASPASILTITFTVKAAGEMRSRILQDATQLLVDKSAQKDFDSTLAAFFQREGEKREGEKREGEKTDIQSKTDSLASTPNFENPYHLQGSNAVHTQMRNPRTAVETAQEILASTQLLKISTIDSLFNQWISKFPFEASGSANPNDADSLPAPFSLMDSLDQSQYDEQAWLDVFNELADSSEISPLDLYEHFESNNSGPLNILEKVRSLHSHQTYLWQARETNKTQFHATDLPDLNPQIETESDLIKAISSELIVCAEAVRNKEEVLQAIRNRNLDDLRKCNFITKANKISGIKIRGSKREALASEIMVIDQEIALFSNYLKIKNLNHAGLALFSLYDKWVRAREQQKNLRNTIEFSDLAKGAYRLFDHQDGAGATWLIQKTVRHLMIDEFQDTSILQWTIFKRLAIELLSGEGVDPETGTSPTIFIVGDEKQSVYGFREGNPIVLKYARETLLGFGKTEIPMNKSFRSAQIILDYVNKVFEEEGISNFPAHSTAELKQGKPFVPNCGMVSIHQLFESDSVDFDSNTLESPLTGVEKEATFVALTLKTALDQPEKHPVYDKKFGSFRPLRLEDCCIMYRNGTHTEVFEQALRDVGLPCLKAEKKGFFQRQEIIDTIALLTFLARPGDTLALMTVLKSPYIRLSDSCVIELAHRAQSLHSLSDSSPKIPSPPTAVPTSTLAERILKTLRKDFESIAKKIDSLLSLADIELPHQILKAAYCIFDAPHAYERAFTSAEGNMAKNNLYKMIEICISVEEKGFASLSQCLVRLQKMSKKNEQGNAPANSKAICLMTVHKSKGLEFPFVCLIETGSDWYKSDRYWVKNETNSGGGISYIGTKKNQPIDAKSFDDIVAMQIKQFEEETYRLMYVALTRSSHYLWMTGHIPRKSSSTTPSSPTIDETGSSIGRTLGKNGSPFSFLWRAMSELVAEVKPGSEPGSEPNRKYQTSESMGSPFNTLVLDHRQGIIASKSAVVHETEKFKSWCPLVLADELPSEIEIIQPHRLPATRRSYASALSRINMSIAHPDLAPLVGNFIHKCFELTVSESLLNPEVIWMNEVQTKSGHKKFSGSEWHGYFNYAFDEFSRCIKSEAWQSLVRSSKHLTAEMEIIHLVNHRMVRGSIDLMVEKSDGGIIIVDYKSAAYAPPIDRPNMTQSEKDADLQIFCQEKGYRDQLDIYRIAIAAMMPEANITIGAFLTKEAAFVVL